MKTAMKSQWRGRPNETLLDRRRAAKAAAAMLMHPEVLWRFLKGFLLLLFTFTVLIYLSD